jgi:inorganic pyrophosphatase
MNTADYLGKNVTIKIDRPMGSKHPKHGFIYPVNYGFVPNTKSGDGEELDAYLLGVFEPVEEYVGKCVAYITRIDDDDDKIIVVPEDKSYNRDQIEALVEFQERFFKHKLMFEA